MEKFAEKGAAQCVKEFQDNLNFARAKSLT
jgi:hypothetical protein